MRPFRPRPVCGSSRITDGTRGRRTVTAVRTPRLIDVLGTLTVLASGGTWLAYLRTGSTTMVFLFFLLCAGGLALEPLTIRRRRRQAR